jgi:glycosyltransferase involved in cell wall biosynthesis
LNRGLEAVVTQARSLRVLFVAQAVSIHTARWISQLRDQGWDLHLFDMLGSLPHPELQGVTEYSMLRPHRVKLSSREPSYGHPLFLEHGWDPFPLSLAGFFVRRMFRNRVGRLAKLIQSLRPDVIHSIELQTESYHLLSVADMLGGSLGAPWIVTTWGSDIFYFQKFPEHLEHIKRLLHACDYLVPDCARDEALARTYGFQGQVPLILPGSGGYRVGEMRKHMARGAASDRRLVVVKGYQGWAGRALAALRALEMTAEELSGHEVIVYAASPPVEREVKALRRRSKLQIRTAPKMPHRDLLALFGRARISIAVNATDGIPNAMLEAMTMGSFPIQSDTGSTSEWITHGQNGLLVDPDDLQGIADAIRRAIADDELVNRAAELNHCLILERLDIDVVLPKVIEMYARVAAEGKRGSV